MRVRSWRRVPAAVGRSEKSRSVTEEQFIIISRVSNPPQLPKQSAHDHRCVCFGREAQKCCLGRQLTVMLK